MALKTKIENIKQDSRFKSRIIYMLLAVITLLIFKMAQYPDQLRVYTPPDLSKSFVQTTNEIPSSTVYGFARSIWEIINYCQDDCGQEFIPKIKKYRKFLTSSCYQELDGHFRSNRSLYSGRSRRLLPVDDEKFSIGFVEKISSDLWQIPLEYVIVNDVLGVATRQEIIRYPLKIVRSYQPISENPWGLAVDCFYNGGPLYIRDVEKK